MHQKKTQEAKNARKESSPHEVGLHLSYRIYTQIPQESPIWSEQAEGDGYNQEAVQEYRYVEIVEGAMCPDHIHMSLRIPPRLSVAYVMGYLKGKSALKLFDENPGLRRLTGKDRTLWARGYYVSTVGINEDVIRKYIKEQEEADQFGAAD